MSKKRYGSRGAYRRRYTQRKYPSRMKFTRLVVNLSETGTISFRERHRRRTRTGEDAEVAVLAAVAHNLHVSIKGIELKLPYQNKVPIAYFSTTDFIHITCLFIKNRVVMILRTVYNSVSRICNRC